ncbi:MAG: NADH-quinone oxidoreductase subunit M [bacterium]|nr:NADH-quinone oxidoreductase subunit M [Candidatus Margulisiibacteriota bacterium]
MINAPILIIAIPLLSAFLIHLTKYTKLKRAPELVATLALLSSAVALFSTFKVVLAGETIFYELGGWPAPFGISLAIDALSLFFAFTTLGVGLMIIVYSLGEYFYARRYYSLLLIALSGILGIVLTRDLFNLYVFFEILAVASYVLVTYKHKARTIVASFKYLIITETAWFFFLLSIALLYVLCGSLNMDSIASQIPLIYQNNQQVLMLIFAIMMVCFGIKSGMFPLHTWVPEVHSQAPTAVSSLLSGLILKVGLYAMLRTFYLFFGAAFLLEHGIGNILILFGVVTLIFGASQALVQNELKRLLAYSSINQIGFILVGIGLGTQGGLTGALFHIFNHAIIKVGLFFCAGIIISQVGFWEISRMKGVWHRMPAATLAFCLLSLAVIGIPPFNGFVSKMFIIEAALLAQNYWLLLPLFFGIILTAAYYFRVIQTFFLPQEFKRKEDFVPTPVGPFEHLSTFFLVSLCLLVGLFPQIILNIIQPAVRVLLP